MPITAKDERNYENPKPGLHQAVCAIVSDIGWQLRNFNGHEDYGHQIIVVWELKSETSKGNRFKVSNFYTLSLNEKAKLRKELESWLGRNLTEAEVVEGYDVESLVGRNCMLNIKHEDKNGKTRAVIASISPLMDGMAEIKPETIIVPEWIERIKERGLPEKPEAEAPEHEEKAPVNDDLPF